MKYFDQQVWPLTQKKWFMRLLPFFVVAAVYGQTVGFDFVNYDDNVNVYANSLLVGEFLGVFAQVWSAPYEGLYVPLTYSLWALLVKISALLPYADYPQNPHLFHGANIFVHGVNTVALTALLRRLLRDEWAALGGALLFALHPVQVESVAWVSSMKDLLMGFFSLLALWHFVLFAQRDDSMNRSLRYALGLIFFGAALLAKPSAVGTVVGCGDRLLCAAAETKGVGHHACPLGGHGLACGVDYQNGPARNSSDLYPSPVATTGGCRRCRNILCWEARFPLDSSP
ncbi:MAG: hypothetical protein Q8J76_14265 [Desulfobulbaceae bacterium]|nr:hypothetical protein [Desulfobulbaceae bacterium]